MGLFENSHFPYTNFHEMNMDKLVETVEGAAGQASALSDRVTTAEQDIDALENTSQTLSGRIDAVNTDINTINGNIDDIESDINALSGRVTTAEQDIDALETRATTSEGDIDALETRLTTAEEDISHKTRTTVQQGSLSAGVLVGTVVVDGLYTRLYAPTAGSTVVTAQDVPTDPMINPAYQSGTVQSVLQYEHSRVAENRTDITSLTGRVNTTESNVQGINTSLDNINSQITNINTALSNIQRQIIDLTRDNIFLYDPQHFDPTETNTFTIKGGQEVYPGFISANGSNLIFFVPYPKLMPTHQYSPLNMPNKWSGSPTSGMITVRDSNGYVTGLNKVYITDIAATQAAKCMTNGILITITLSNPIVAANNHSLTINGNGIWFVFEYDPN